MKRKNIIFLLGVVFTILIIVGCKPLMPKAESESLPPTPLKTEPVKEETCLLVVDEWSPYTSEEMPYYGIATQIVTAALEASNIPYEVKFVPWSRALEMVKYGEAWATFPWFNTNERDQDYYFSEPIIHVKSTIFYNTNNPKLASGVPPFKTIADLKDYVFGGVNGYYYEAIFEKEGYHYALSQSLESAFKLLIDGKVDVINEDEVVGHYVLDQYFSDFKTRIQSTSTYLSTEPMYLLIGKSDTQVKWLDGFNKGLEIIKENGTYDAIINARISP